MFRGILVCSLTLLSVIGVLLAAPSRSAASSSDMLPRAQTGPTDPVELAAWLDPLIEEKMQEARIPGVVFLVVKDGQVAYARGYGQADLERQTPVDVENNLWRVMSLSKPVTAAAVMQLAEQGKLDLHADVNTYLRTYRLPEAFGQPITADHLLTHSAGLDWDLDDIGTLAATPEDLPGNAQFLNDQPPARILPPGQHTLYSNAAYDLAGQMVEDISGMPFADYVAHHIFRPLGMARSSFVQPPPQPDGLVTGYEFDGERHQPLDLPLFKDPPSRSMTATAPDMARFIQALLGNGSPILQPATLQMLLATQFTYAAGTPGLAYGWNDMPWPGARVLWKDGADAGALSRILLAPERELGVFLAYNLDDGFGLAGAVTDELLQRAFPYEAQVPSPVPGAQERAAALAGIYRLTTYSHHTIAKGLRLAWSDYPVVSASADGRLLVQFSPDASTVHELLEVEPLRYRSSDGRFDYVFWQNAQGSPGGLASGAYVAEKVAWYDTSRMHQFMLIGFLIVFLAGATAGLIISIRRPSASRLGRRSVWLLTLTAALNAIFLIILVLVLGVADIDMSLGMPGWLAALAAGPMLTGLFAVALAALGVANWRRHALARRGLALYGLFTLVALAFIPWLNYWNLLGFRW